ncbi:MAG: nucleotidyl transferase AbiEii/AbiGii toxin family protein [Firmicutes bacterium]|nr:nucleotidyl transferase AbiEii/AbiGii toxin family protein [Bacillota bacterium]
MSSKAMSMKGRINRYAKQNNIAAQVVLQNYMFERFLERLSKSEYQEKFVIKGGILVAAIVGLDTRSTMDLDATLRNLPLTEETITQAVQSLRVEKALKRYMEVLL